MKKIVDTTVYGILVAAAIWSSACTRNYYYCPGVDGTGKAIMLSSEVQFGAEPRLQDNQIFNGQSLSLFVTRTGSRDTPDWLYANNRITANGTGGFTYRTPMFFPSDGTAVDLYAVHPYGATTSLATPLTFAVQADQTQQGNYLGSDLLLGARTNVAPQSDAIPLTFRHKLSKLDFVITTGSTTIDLNRLTGINVLNSLPETTLRIDNGEISAATGTPSTIRAYGVANVTGGLGSQSATGFTAIVVPQTATGAQPLFELIIDGRSRFHTPAAPVSFAAGTKYTVTLDVSVNGVSLTSRIEDWTDGGTIGGPAGPQ